MSSIQVISFMVKAHFSSKCHASKKDVFPLLGKMFGTWGLSYVVQGEDLSWRKLALELGLG
jgi:hypothetical protein